MVKTRNLSLRKIASLMIGIKKQALILFFLACITTFCFGQQDNELIKVTVNGSIVYVNSRDNVSPIVNGIGIDVAYGMDGRDFVSIWNETQKK